MIGHILKKDLRLLWPLVAVVAALHAAAAGLLVLRVRLELQGFLAFVAVFLLPALAAISTVLPAVAVVHQDVLPGPRADWLVRPIRHRDLLSAKLLFCLILVLGPAWLADCLLGLANGFPLSDSAAAAGSRGFFLLCLFVLPAFLLAAVTQSLIEVAIIALGALALFAGIWLPLASSGIRPGLGGGSWSWLLLAAWDGLSILAALAVLRLQYFGRRTAPARCAIGIAIALGCLVPLLMTWKQGYAMNALFAPEPASAADPVSLAFDPEHAPVPSGAAPVARVCTNGCPVAIVLPLRVSELPGGARVLTDRVEVRIRSRDANEPSGHEIYHGFAAVSFDGAGSISAQDTLLVALRPNEAGARGSTAARQRIYLPAATYRLVQSRTVELDLDYDLTLLRARAPLHMAALGDEESFSRLGRCVTKVDSDEDAVTVGCQTLNRDEVCFTAVLEDRSSGRRNPETWLCALNYGPRLLSQGLASVEAFFDQELPFRDLNGLAVYPVDGSKLTQARIEVQPYEPQAHFQRRLIIPEIRLSDWEAKSPT